MPLKYKLESRNPLERNPLLYYVHHMINRYPLPIRSEEILTEFKSMANCYGILCNSIMVRNPQANTIVKRVPQTIGNIKLYVLYPETKFRKCKPFGTNSLMYYDRHIVYSAHYYAAHTVTTGIW